MQYNEVIGSIMKELMREIGWSADKLARNLTMQCYKNLPKADASEFELFDELKKYKINTREEIKEECQIKDYINNKHKKQNSVFVLSMNREITLSHSISKNTMHDYLSGRTPVPLIVIISFCQIFNLSIDSFMSKVYEELNIKWETQQISDEQTYVNFFKKIFSESKDDRYVFDGVNQGNLLSSLLLEGKEELQFHFTYLPRKLGLKSLKDQKQVTYQRGILTFLLKDGVCHVTSKLEVSSQGVPTEYRGFAIITNPNSSGPACTCFLKEINNSFGIFIVFSFRLSSIDRMQKRKTRISECIAVRKDDGTSYVYRLLLSKNYIDDDMMKYFAGHLKLSTSENTVEGKELNILINEKYFDIAKKYFNGSQPGENSFEKTIYKDLKEYFKDNKHDIYLEYIKK